MDQSLSLIPGQNTAVPLETLKVEIKSGAQADFSAFRLFQNDKTQVDEDFIFYGQTCTSDGSISLEQNQCSGVFTLKLNDVAPSVQKIALCVTTDLANISRLGTLTMTIRSHGSTLFVCPVKDLENKREKAIILGEFYRRNGSWKFRFVVQGYMGGLANLAIHYGVDLSEDSKPQDTNAPVAGAQPQHKIEPSAALSPSISSAPASSVNPTPASDSRSKVESNSGASSTSPYADERNNAWGGDDDFDADFDDEFESEPYSSFNNEEKIPSEPINLRKIVLTKNSPKISLQKNSRLPNFFKVNLNWHQGVYEDASFWSGLYDTEPTESFDIDLDLGAYVKFKDGSQTIVQALGNRFGSLDERPYIKLLGDDRTGEQTEGEWIYVNPKHLDKISEIVFFTFIYQGVPNWSMTDGVVRIQIEAQPEIETHLMEGDNSLSMCAIARLTNENETLKIERIDRYFEGHLDMDEFFGWGFQWKPGTKD